MTPRGVLPGRRVAVIVRCGMPVLIVTCVLATFVPVLGNDFVNWDDNVSFTQNPNYRGLSARHLRWMFTTTLMGHYQPLSWLSHALVYAVWGMDPRGYHLVNLGLHLANAVAVYALILALLECAWRDLGDRNGLAMSVAAAVGTLAFAIHPLRVEPVAWVTERRELLCSFFLLLSLLAYLRMHTVAPAGRGVRLAWHLLSLACFALSLLSKATGLTFPVVLLALDISPLGRLSGRDGRSQRWIWVLVEKVPYVLFASAAAGLALVTVKRTAMLPLAEHGWMQRTMQAAYGLCFYLWKTLVPLRLSPLYLLPRPFDPLQPVYVLSALTVAAITISLIVWRRRYPWALTAWAGYVVLVSPVLGFAQSGPQIAADRYTYLPCLPWAVLATAGVYRLWLAVEVRPVFPLAKYAGVVAVTVTLIGLALETRALTHVWKDSLSLWNRVLQIEPHNYFALNNRGVALKNRGDVAGALQDYDAALRLHEDAETYNNRGNARLAKGDLQGALDDFTQALLRNPEYADAFYNRANVRQTHGDGDGALADYTQALRLKPYDARAYYSRGNLRQAHADLKGALADYDAAIRLDPSYADAYTNRGTARQANGDVPGALADFSEALHLNPADANAAYNRGNARKARGDFDGAFADYTYAIRQNPHHAGAYNNRGRLRRDRGDLDGARADYNAAIHANPQSANSYNNRASLRRDTGDVQGAVADYTEALRLAGNGPLRLMIERNLQAARAPLADAAANR